MAGGTGQARGEVSSEPNVVPMIDILLVLLIIFMITQPLSRTTISVQVAPPIEDTQVKSENNTQIVLRRGFAVVVTVLALALLLDVLVLGGPPG